MSVEIDQLCVGCMEERGAADVCSRCGWREGSKPESPLYLPPRTILDDQYMIGRVLGYGGFGITYLGWDMNLARKLAVKEYMPNGVASRASGDLKVTVFRGQADNEFEYGMQQFLEMVLPAFKWLTWWGFLLGLLESFLYGVYAGLVFCPIYNLLLNPQQISGRIEHTRTVTAEPALATA